MKRAQKEILFVYSDIFDTDIVVRLSKSGKMNSDGIVSTIAENSSPDQLKNIYAIVYFDKRPAITEEWIRHVKRDFGIPVVVLSQYKNYDDAWCTFAKDIEPGDLRKVINDIIVYRGDISNEIPSPIQDGSPLVKVGRLLYSGNLEIATSKQYTLYIGADADAIRRQCLSGYQGKIFYDIVKGLLSGKCETLDTLAYKYYNKPYRESHAIDKRLFDINYILFNEWDQMIAVESSRKGGSKRVYIKSRPKELRISVEEAEKLIRDKKRPRLVEENPDTTKKRAEINAKLGLNKKAPAPAPHGHGAEDTATLERPKQYYAQLHPDKIDRPQHLDKNGNVCTSGTRQDPGLSYCTFDKKRKGSEKLIYEGEDMEKIRREREEAYWRDLFIFNQCCDKTEEEIAAEERLRKIAEMNGQTVLPIYTAAAKAAGFPDPIWAGEYTGAKIEIIDKQNNSKNGTKLKNNSKNGTKKQETNIAIKKEKSVQNARKPSATVKKKIDTSIVQIAQEDLPPKKTLEEIKAEFIQKLKEAGHIER